MPATYSYELAATWPIALAMGLSGVGGLLTGNRKQSEHASHLPHSPPPLFLSPSHLP